MRTEEELEEQGVEPNEGEEPGGGDAGEDATSPDEPVHEASAPPGNPEQDEEATREAEDRLDQAGGGH